MSDFLIEVFFLDDDDLPLFPAHCRSQVLGPYSELSRNVHPTGRFCHFRDLK